MGRLITISGKVPEKLKKEAEALGINVSELIRTALKEEVRKRKVRALLKELRKELEESSKLPSGTIVKIIREIRERS
jgi:post-segregation antitoxin (ccd killing protein)